MAGFTHDGSFTTGPLTTGSFTARSLTASSFPVVHLQRFISRCWLITVREVRPRQVQLEIVRRNMPTRAELSVQNRSICIRGCKLRGGVNRRE
jgi:hypothetical protein